MTPGAATGRVLAVCRVHALRQDPGSVGVTAIDKRPVDGPVAVRAFGLYGDVQADRQHHGGPDKAVYAYADESAAAWAVELGRDLPPGALGENLRTSGLPVDGAELGERWQVGDHLVVEVTMPRTPCATFGRFLEEPAWVRRFTERGLSGAYLRVVRPGDVQAGDEVRVVTRPGHGVTVTRWFTRRAAVDARVLLSSADAGGFTMSPVLREYAEQAAGRG